ncbi:efflux RND transporter permease subunit [Opitutia bacterium ISCC 51]|nr:efflux RND transporter permease subunit [Opitutae bacterium ISCC 51]QXD27963.1 efflux RND transporter permease subunit [Opitutae bacterium ISCC 52]
MKPPAIDSTPSSPDPRPTSLINWLIRACLENKLIIVLLTVGLIFWGLMVAPFNWDVAGLERDPVPVDAIPDIGENQQIVFTDWKGRSPQDIEDQITYPLTTALLGLPKVKTVRSFSMFGFSSIYIIFEEEAEFYWTRSRILEKLNSLPSGTLPEGVAPRLGPDATALGQVFWYTLEGRDEDGNPTSGWDLHERRSVQDWYVRFALQGVEGIAEVSSVGGYVKEYQIDVDPDALRTYQLTLQQVFNAVRASNIDVGARTVEINSVEYVIRGLGFIENLEDLRQTVVAHHNHVPITLDQVAEIEFGPAVRRGVLDKEGAETVGGVVVARYGENPMAAIQAVKKKIEEISPGLPSKTLEDGTQSQLTIVPFYDRSGLIIETLGTLENAVTQQILVTIIVVLLMVLHLRSAALISSILPLAVLFSFIGMSVFGVDANVVALSGIAIAIGTIVDMGVVLTENILKHKEAAKRKSAPYEQAEPSSQQLVFNACSEVGGAIVTAVLTTVISFLPVFTMQAAEGKLFKPLAYTKTFALLGSILVALTILPPIAQWLIAGKNNGEKMKRLLWILVALLTLIEISVLGWLPWMARILILCIAGFHLLKGKLPTQIEGRVTLGFNILVALLIANLLAGDWSPLGPERSIGNLLFVILAIGLLLGAFLLFIRIYPQLLGFILKVKTIFLSASGLLVVAGFLIAIDLKEEFMPSLDEGSFLWMPTTMPHASVGEVLDVIQKQDKAIRGIHEVDTVVGKLGRVDSPLDPAPVSMIETIINYVPEYEIDEDGNILTYKFDKGSHEFVRDPVGDLIPDRNGKPFRNWRDHIRSADDIWKEIVSVAQVPGTTSAPKLQPIAARLVMLQSGMRSPMGIKVFGPDLESLETAALQIESALKKIPSVNSATVFADRVVGKPYMEIDINRESISRYGMSIQSVQDVIEVAVGGRHVTQTVEGRERYPVRVRYMRELRDNFEEIGNILVASPDGLQIPLKQLADINYVRGPQVIKSEDTFLMGYVIFDKAQGYSEVEVAEDVESILKEKEAAGTLVLPESVTFKTAGNYENQQRAAKRLMLVIPMALVLIFIILYLQFRRVLTSLLIFTGIAFAWSGGFILIWLYGQPWFLDITVLGANLRDLFQVHPINLSVAVWVGFLALFGIATDDGVLICTYLRQTFRDRKPTSVATIREAVIYAGTRRVRPALMTSATTILALLPVLTSTGRGSDIMVPMAIPTFGGMLLALITIFVVPVLYSMIEELKLKLRLTK